MTTQNAELDEECSIAHNAVRYVLGNEITRQLRRDVAVLDLSAIVREESKLLAEYEGDGQYAAEAAAVTRSSLAVAATLGKHADVVAAMGLLHDMIEIRDGKTLQDRTLENVRRKLDSAIDELTWEIPKIACDLLDKLTP